MSKRVYLSVSLAIRDGKLEEFKTVAREMVDATRKEAGTLGYEWYLSSDGQRCQLLETYADADALLAHFGGPAVQIGVPKMMVTANVTGFQVYGDPGPKAKEILSGFGAEIFSYWHGMGR
ncbi:MAG TPA: putative quinol monooxygenase [Verrucomicrobiae bacterium]|nr:putative quinol monooxygenase [Verrucomicrobiae bacterium]